MTSKSVQRVQRFKCAGCSLVWNCGQGPKGDEPEYYREGREATARDHQPGCRLPEISNGFEDWIEIGEPEARLGNGLLISWSEAERLMAEG